MLSRGESYLLSALILFTCLFIIHSVGFYTKYDHFCPAFRDKIDESFLSFFSLTLILLNIYFTARSLVEENE